VGQELARAARKTRRGVVEMARLLDWSPTTVSRLHHGKRGASPENLSAYLALCGVTSNRRKELIEIATDAYGPNWWQDHGTRPPIHHQPLNDNEAIAERITCFGSTLVPDLLQVPDYTRALLATQPYIPADEIDERIGARMQRQSILDRGFGSPDLSVFVTEYALTRTGAGDTVMSEQAHHLLSLTVRPAITIRLLPEDSAVPDIAPFSLLEFADEQPAVYVEHATSTAFLERPDTIATYGTIIAALDRLALSEADSRAQITAIAQRRSTQPMQPAEQSAIWVSG
jgi:hypothetical protein